MCIFRNNAWFSYQVQSKRLHEQDPSCISGRDVSRQLNQKSITCNRPFPPLPGQWFNASEGNQMAVQARPLVDKSDSLVSQQFSSHVVSFEKSLVRTNNVFVYVAPGGYVHPCCSKALPVTKLWEGSPPQGSLYCARGPCWWQNDGNVFLREEVWSCNPLGGEGHAWTALAVRILLQPHLLPNCAPHLAHLQPIPGGRPTQQIGVLHILQPHIN